MFSRNGRDVFRSAGFVFPRRCFSNTSTLTPFLPFHNWSRTEPLLNLTTSSHQCRRGVWTSDSGSTPPALSERDKEGLSERAISVVLPTHLNRTWGNTRPDRWSHVVIERRETRRRLALVSLEIHYTS